MVKVSVVIPVYNVEKYLEDCLDSIVNQTLTNLEIICINDGSTDNSLNILNEYAKNDSRISVYSQKNGGHAVATNRGIDLATGDFLFCMDSDDVLALNALELTYNAAIEKDVDFVIFKAINYDDVSDTYYETEVYSMDPIAEVVGESVFNYQDIGELMFSAIVTPWSKLYKREFILKHNIRFPEGLIFEDNVFFFESMLKAERIYFLKEFLFTRRWYASSSTTAGDLRFLDSIKVSNLVFDVFREQNEFDNYKYNLYNNKISLVFMRYDNIKEEFKEAFFQAMKKDFIKLLDEKYYSDFENSLEYTNHKIFEQVILARNSIEMNLIRRVYNTKMNNYKYVEIASNHKFVKRHVDYYLSLESDDKKNYFDELRNMFISIANSDETYRFLAETDHPVYKTIFDQMIISNNYDEFNEIRNIYDKKNRIKSINQDLINNKERLSDVSKINNELINSNSWKLTKILRILRNKLKMFSKNN